MWQYWKGSQLYLTTKYLGDNVGKLGSSNGLLCEMKAVCGKVRQVHRTTTLKW